MVSTYQPLKDDGAPFKCADCGQKSHASLMWFVRLDDGAAYVFHKNCLDEDWFEFAKFIDEPI